MIMNVYSIYVREISVLILSTACDGLNVTICKKPQDEIKTFDYNYLRFFFYIFTIIVSYFSEWYLIYQTTIS